MLDYPLLGVGPGNYGTAFPAYYKKNMQPSQYAHNTYLQLFSELGIPLGCILLILFLSWSIKIIRKFNIEFSKNDKTQFLLCLSVGTSALTFLTNNLFEINAYFASIGFVGFFFLALFHKLLFQYRKSHEGVIFSNNTSYKEKYIKVRDKEGTVILIILWFLFTALLAQRFVGLILYETAGNKYQFNQLENAELDLRISRFVDPIDSRYFYLNSLIKKSYYNKSRNPKDIISAIDQAEHAVRLNPKTPYLRRNLALIYLKAGMTWKGLNQYQWADYLISYIGKYRKELEKLKTVICTIKQVE